jgi:protein gp37
MGSETGIAWTDHTFNPWWGCEKVSPGCAHCYAESWDARWKGGHWGKDSPRRFFGEKHWNEPRTWNAAALKAGQRARVFCASMADVFEDRRDLDEERNRLFVLIRETPQLDWQLLTKRPENVLRLLPPGVVLPWPNIWIGTTVEDQKRADARIPALLQVPAAVRFLSVEPLLGPISFRWAPWVPLSRVHSTGHLDGLNGIHWGIVGGESGQGARPMALEWARTALAQFREAGVRTFVKQLGGARDKRDDPAGWPVDLRVREFPT